MSLEIKKNQTMDHATSLLTPREQKILHDADYAVASLIALAGVPIQLHDCERSIEEQLYERARAFHPDYGAISQIWSELYRLSAKEHGIALDYKPGSVITIDGREEYINGRK